MTILWLILLLLPTVIIIVWTYYKGNRIDFTDWLFLFLLFSPVFNWGLLIAFIMIDCYYHKKYRK